MSYILLPDNTIQGSGAGLSVDDERVKVSGDDSTTNFLENKILEGTGINLTVQNPAGNENILIEADINDFSSSFAASNITYAPDTLTDWDGDIDPGNTDGALDQLASRVDTLENTSGPTPDASGITYTPGLLSNWTGSADPGNVDAALDQLASRLTIEEGSNPDAADVTYSPAAVANWNSSTDPGDTNDALDQLASRVNSLESTGAAAIVGVSATDTTPDFLLNKLTGGTGITLTRINAGSDEELTITRDVIDAADVTYTPLNSGNWNGATDPGETNDALDQLVDRVNTLEGTVGAPDASVVTYAPSNLTHWTGSADPGNTNSALDQLASRMDAVETSVTVDASTVTYTPAVLTNWSGDADPGDVDEALDQLASRVDTNESDISTLQAATVDASAVTYTPNTLTDWDGDIDPGDVDEALDQLASRIDTTEGNVSTNTTNISTNAGDISAIQLQIPTPASASNYIPAVLANWNGSLDPGAVNDGLDQLAARVKTLEDSPGDASEVTYSPSVLTNWNGDTDPGDTNDALDQLADRVETLEGTVGASPDASATTYTPAVLTDWDSDTDPGNVDGALDQLASRVDTLELGGGSPVDAAGVTYTPGNLTNWNSDLDPGNADGALDQLADRVNTLESAGGATSAIGFVAVDTVIDDARTIPTDHQMIVVNDINITGSGELTINGELHVLQEDPIVAAVNVNYDPTILSDWDSSTDPGGADSALDQLASRVKTIEDSGGAGVTLIYTTHDPFAPPVTPLALSDEFDDNNFTGWLDYSPNSSALLATENSFGALFTSTSTDTFARGHYKVIPAGDFTFDLQITPYPVFKASNNDYRIGLFLLEGILSSSDFISHTLFVDNNTTRTLVEFSRPQLHTGNSDTGSDLSSTGDSPSFITGGAILRIRRNGVNYFFECSTDGIGWISLSGTAGVTLPFAPANIAIGIQATAAVGSESFRSRFFRYTDSDVGFYEPLLGQSISVLNT